VTTVNIVPICWPRCTSPNSRTCFSALIRLYTGQAPGDLTALDNPSALAPLTALGG
jgi:hypothetical protein